MPFTAQGITPDIIINPCCLAGETQISLEDLQTTPISKIVEDEKRYTVQSVNPSEFTSLSSQICNSFAIKPTHRMLKISTISGRTIMCTADHKFLTHTNTWIEAQNLTPLHSLTVLHTTKSLSTETHTVYKLSEDKLHILARLMGSTTSHGFTGMRNAGKIRLFAKSIRDTLAFTRDIKSLLNTDEEPVVIRLKGVQELFNVIIPKDNCLEVFTEYGYEQYTFRVPEFVKNGSLETKRQFLCGLKECDIENFLTVEVTSIFDPDEDEKEYLQDLKKLFRDIGVYSEIIKIDDFVSLYIDDSYSNLEKYYDLVECSYSTVDRINSRHAIEYIKMRNRGVNKPLTEMDNTRIGECIRVAIGSVQEIEVPEFVYDFETISSNHSFVANSIVVHNCIPSRMTVGQLIECALGKDCALTGRYGDATPFTTNSADVADKLVKEIKERLDKTGFSSHGWEKMYDALTGEEIEARIFIGPTYYQRLKHMVDDKMHARARGHVTTLTRQPLNLRAVKDDSKKVYHLVLIISRLSVKITP